MIPWVLQEDARMRRCRWVMLEIPTGIVESSPWSPGLTSSIYLIFHLFKEPLPRSIWIWSRADQFIGIWTELRVLASKDEASLGGWYWTGRGDFGILAVGYWLNADDGTITGIVNSATVNLRLSILEVFGWEVLNQKIISEESWQAGILRNFKILYGWISHENNICGVSC